MAQDVAELKNVEASENSKCSYMNVLFFLNTSIYRNYRRQDIRQDRLLFSLSPYVFTIHTFQGAKLDIRIFYYTDFMPELSLAKQTAKFTLGCPERL